MIRVFVDASVLFAAAYSARRARQAADAGFEANSLGAGQTGSFTHCGLRV